MSLYRFADVHKILLELGTHIEPNPVIMHIDDQRAPLLGGFSHAFAEVHAASPDLIAHRDAFGFGLCLLRAFVPFITETNTGSMLSAPVWPQFRTYSQERARSYRSAAEADSGSDYATPEALTVWRSIMGRAALIYLEGLGSEGRARLFDHMPYDMNAPGTLSRVVAELHDLSAMFETLDGIRQRVEARAEAMGHPPPRDGYRFNRVAALDFFTLSRYLDCLPAYESEVRRRAAIDFADVFRLTERARRIVERNARRSAALLMVWGSGAPIVVAETLPPLVPVDFTGETWDESGTDSDDYDADEINELTGYITDENEIPVPWSTVEPCPFIMFDEYDGIEIDETQTCAICLDECRDGLAIFENCEKHAVHRDCARAMQLTNFMTQAPNKCPTCRRSPLITGPDAHGCEICHKGNRTVTLFTLGGGCECGAVYCWACLPGEGVDCCRRCGATE